jgi:hypothetical protein
MPAVARLVPVASLCLGLVMVTSPMPPANAGVPRGSSAGHRQGSRSVAAGRRHAWLPMPVPHVELTGPPQVAVSVSGEVWIAGFGVGAMRHKPVVLFRTGGTWSRLANRVLDRSLESVVNPIPVGAHGIWFEFGLYWSGRAVGVTAGRPHACQGGYYAGGGQTFMVGIPGTDSVPPAAACQPSGDRYYEGQISITTPG